jgi:hypothetical protein
MHDIFKQTKYYQIVTAFCFGGTNVHIQCCNFATADEAVKFLDEDNARSEKWKAEGHTLYKVQVNIFNSYNDTIFGIYAVSESDLRSHAAEKKEGVS